MIYPDNDKDSQEAVETEEKESNDPAADAPEEDSDSDDGSPSPPQPDQDDGGSDILKEVFETWHTLLNLMAQIQTHKIPYEKTMGHPKNS